MDYSTKSVEELRGICKEKNIKGVSKKKKDELIKLLESIQLYKTYKNEIENINGYNINSVCNSEIAEIVKSTSIANEIYESVSSGYSESIYHNAMKVGLQDEGIRFETEKDIPVHFRGQQVGTVRADLVVNKKIVIELKAVNPTDAPVKDATEQCIKYMELEKLNYGMVIVFPKRNIDNLKIIYITKDE
jgi:GxxExxY protein